MKIIKFLKSQKFRNIVLYTLLWIFTLYVWVFIYSIIFERDKLVIDRYNFEQLENTKPILASIKKTNEWVFSLKEFNKKYHTSLKPINKCYFVRNFNGDYPYIFWFQLESLIYKFLYFWKNYAYPKYALPYSSFCIWWPGWWCYDWSKELFKLTIDKPCKED